MKCSANYNLVTEASHVAKTWNYEKNIGKSPFDYAPKSQQKVWWKCDFNPSHEWEARISNRTIKHEGCPHCFKELKVSFPARIIYYYLKILFATCELEYKVANYYVDIYIKELSLAIEHDGIYHHSSQKSIEREKRKDNILKKNKNSILHIKECIDLKNITETKNNTIYYCKKYQYKDNLNDIVQAIIQYISNITKQNYHISVNMERDYLKIEQLFFHEKKKRTIAYTHPKLMKEWSPNNAITPDMVCSKNKTKFLWICPNCHNEYSATLPNRINQNSGCPFCSNMKVNINNCLATQYPELIKEWDTEKNQNLTPFDVVPGAEKRIWWKCSICGQSWDTWLYQRTGKRKSNCPFCSHNKVYKEISFGYLYPNLVKWWYQEKNHPLTPYDLTAKSNHSVYWKCIYCHHVFKKSPNQLIYIMNENKCPECRKNKKLYKQIEKIKFFWSNENKMDLTINLMKSEDLYIFKCQKNHIWKDTIPNMYRKKKKCPYCNPINKKGPLPKILQKEWNYEKNKELQPEFFSSGSGKKVWWKCANGHEWEETIQKRAIRHFGCPYCSGKRASKENSFETKYPHLLSFWDQEKNTILPSQVTAGSGISIYFKCPNCNYSFERTVINMTKSQKCPNCKNAKRMLKLNIQYPELIKEWNYSKNEHPPEYYSAHSNQKVWWKCANGHEWETQIYSRTAKHTGCPYCYKNQRKRKTI